MLTLKNQSHEHEKLLFTIGCTIVLLGKLYGQDCEGFYPMNKGNVMELTSYNEKDKLQSVSTTTITDRASGPDGITLQMHSSSRDEKGKSMAEVDFDARCSEGVFYMSMKTWFRPNNWLPGRTWT